MTNCARITATTSVLYSEQQLHLALNRLLAFSHNGELVALTAWTFVVLWDVSSDKILRKLDGSHLFALSHDSKLYLVLHLMVFGSGNATLEYREIFALGCRFGIWRSPLLTD